MLKLWLRLCGDTGLTLTDESVEELHSEVIYIVLISQGDIQVFVNRRIHSPRLVQLNELQSRCSNAPKAEMCFQLQNITTWLDGNASYAWQRVFLLGAKDRPAPDYLHMRICVQTLM